MTENQTLNRQVNLDYLKVTAILCIFIMHTKWITTYPELHSAVFAFFVGSLLFASAYLVAKALDNQRRFWASRFKSTYLPYAAIVTFAVLAGMWLPTTFEAWIISLTPIPIFETWKPDLRWLWFMPMFFGLLILFAVMHRFVQKDRDKVLILAGLETAAFLARLWWSPLRTIDEFPLFLPVFSFGYFFGKGAISRKQVESKKWLIALGVVAVVAVFMFASISVLVPAWGPKPSADTAIRMLYYYGFGAALAISGSLLLLRFFKGAKPNRIITALSTSILLIYLLEPYLSCAVSYGLYGNLDYYANETLLFEAIRIPVVLAVTVTLQYLVVNNLKKINLSRILLKAKKNPLSHTKRRAHLGFRNKLTSPIAVTNSKPLSIKV